MARPSIELTWCRDAGRARRLAAIFSENLTASYISHSELQGPRALEPGKWAPNIAQVLEADLLGRVSNPDDASPNGVTMLAAGVADGGSDVGVLLATFSRAATVPSCILEDIVIRSELRDKGYGKICLNWLDSECRKRGITRLFLESGANNYRAHELFERDGFKQISIVMMKNIGG